MFNTAKQSIPPLFEQIMRNDKQRAELQSEKIVDFERGKLLLVERGLYRRAAELFIQKAKGATKL